MRRIVVGIVIALAVVLAVFVVWDTSRSRYDPAAPYQDKIAYWRTRIHAVGGMRAYRELAASQERSDAGTGHAEAHIFGSALYSEEGIQGVAVCDERFAYACFHELIAEALVGRGIESLQEIIESCKGIPGCRHGIGHGVLALAGYTFSDLQKAVSICATLPSGVYVHGCYGGVFMEYNIRRLLGAGHERPIGKNVFEPCDDFSGPARRICYFWQPMWWQHNLWSAGHSMSPSALEEMGARCRTVQNNDLRSACIEGLGVSALNAGWTAQDGTFLCDTAVKDIHGQALCRTSVARYIALIYGIDQGRSVCLGLTGVYPERCMRVIGTASPEDSYLGEMFPFEK